jgi:hypothetical protein
MTTLPAVLAHVGADHIADLLGDQPLEQIGRRVPLDICRKIAEEGKVIVAAAIGVPEATKQARKLIGYYPREPHDPDAYTVGIVSLLAEQALDVCKEGIDRITKRMKYLPTRADLQETFDAILADRRRIRGRAMALLDYFEKRNQDQNAAQARAAERQALKDTLGAAYDDWWKVPLDRRYWGTAEAFAAGWHSTHDKAGFCAGWGAPPKPAPAEG